MIGECRVIVRALLGIDGTNALVPMKIGATLYVLGEPDAHGFVEVNCVCCAKNLRVFARDMDERTKIAKGAAGDD